MKQTASLIILSFLCFTGFAQQGHSDKHKEIEAQKRAYMTEKLQLSVEEAEKFWPLYNEYQEKRGKLKHERRALKPSKPLSELSDSEIDKIVSKTFEIKQRELNLEKEYFDKFKKVITTRKAAMIDFVEEGFKREVLKKLREQWRDEKK